MLKRIQEQHAIWLQARYPGQHPQLPAAGMVEEAAELLHALLAMWREQQWGPDKRYPNINGDLFDAVGDCFIYFCSFCNTVEWNLCDFDVEVLDRSTASPVDMAVQLVRTATEFYSTFSADYAILYIAQLKRIAQAIGVDFGHAVVTTWEKVRNR